MHSILHKAFSFTYAKKEFIFFKINFVTQYFWKLITNTYRLYSKHLLIAKQMCLHRIENHQVCSK